MNRYCFWIVMMLLVTSCKQPEAIKSGANADATTLYEGQDFEWELPLTTVALGSCNRQDLEQPMWPFIVGQEPQLWIWLGDNIYGDSKDMAVLRNKYLKQKAHPGYRQLRENTMIIGTWDDHDFGINDGGKEFSKKAESRDLMLDFLDVPQDAEVRKREGAYQAFIFGPPGQRVKVLLLDARYFRDKLKRGAGGKKYAPNPEGDVLGEEQWSWLEQELTDSPAQIHLIGSGIQIIPEEHGFEKWANLPTARQRLFELLKKTNPANTIFLSGDRHIAEISKIQIDGMSGAVYEITSSGLTHSYESVGDEPNRHRVGNIIGQKNFGLLKIDWSKEKPGIVIEVRGLDNARFLQTVVGD